VPRVDSEDRHQRPIRTAHDPSQHHERPDAQRGGDHGETVQLRPQSGVGQKGGQQPEQHGTVAHRSIRTLDRMPASPRKSRSQASSLAHSSVESSDRLHAHASLEKILGCHIIEHCGY